MNGLTASRVGPVLLLTIQRPDKRNAVDHMVLAAMSQSLDMFEADDTLRTGIISGADGTFCAGADLADRLAGNKVVDANGFAGVTRRRRTKPLIAAVEGYAVGGGFELALSCDMIVASRTAKFGLPEVKRSVLAAEGGLFRTARALGKSTAMHIALTGQPIDATRLYELGLVCELTAAGEALSAAVRIAEEIGANPKEAVLESRALIEQAVEYGADSLWADTRRAYSRIRRSANYRRGAQAFVSKESPEWD
ncbi:enoyl-CoA hydratase-related protein [Nocardia abscessus]|uniref:enoyl-CoA hydratase-related protein n=1 Tax=Nocardia TaxID=1817 RepID=UPI00189532D9|nr:enoyl-CoA hydratase-related protein [Nocardia abscessus]MBF6472588.1 enoyl-CoA hydratase/isomerase family protein [Nocardia abscessus]